MKSSCCPICQKPTVTEHRPFCSDRCRLRDLGQWLNGGYAVPSVETELPDEDDLPDNHTH